MNLEHESLTNEIISAFYKVYNTLGYGFLEKVYENALYLELTSRGIECKTQQQNRVFYEGSDVGFYIADMVVENLVIVEIKAAEALCEQHEYQLINYLRATDKKVGLLLNFGQKPQFRRKIFTINKTRYSLKPKEKQDSK
jgi:GxxExxY protein